ncbi:MAG: histidine phosphatase family protein [Candidatus Buchananbacteria bacterium]
MVKIIFESHATTLDNEAHLASGHFDVELSDLGRQQAKDLGQRYNAADLAAIFCSDLKRSYQTAEIAFAGKNIKIIKDARLRECDYGDWQRKPSEMIEAMKSQHISVPFTNGQSYEQTTQNMKEFLQWLEKNYDTQTVLIIGHRATQYALENLINQIPLTQIITQPWHWQPGWVYLLEKI